MGFSTFSFRCDWRIWLLEPATHWWIKFGSFTKTPLLGKQPFGRKACNFAILLTLESLEELNQNCFSFDLRFFFLLFVFLLIKI